MPKKFQVAMAAAMLMVLTGCETLLPKGADPTPPPETTTDPTPQGPIDDVVGTDNQRHKVALLLPLSGSNSGIGTSIANATTQALLDTEAQNIRITRYDTAKGATAAAQQAIADGNKLILGPLLSDNVRAAANVATPANVPIISYSNDSSVASNMVFIMGFVPDQSIERVVRHARAQGMNRFAGLIPNGVYGQRASSALLQAVRNAGGSVVRMETYNRSRSSLESAISGLAEVSDYDALLIADNGQTAIRAVPQVRNSGATRAKILGTELWNTDTTLSGAPSMRGAWFASVSDELYRQYATKYRQRFGSQPFRLSSLGYDSVLLTYRVAREWPMGSLFPVDRLRESGGFVGLDGAFRFGPTGIAERALEVQEIRTSGNAIISAAPRSFED
ncbi:penicillin-binding protein activator [Alterisphingorhabdus coralli]|uniref:Penicillin-binding protein activator n=1 Tax=Alterisphingorhabdus coralli TaxID=3071408 RepID=A0AA97I0V9_9SPHN|nr:penicillin-binding protein activator [Parasphingorhabdus sp. SCSIO 66989]WOE74165.1 penicillin-binding protein activator [Parasphingorhabdus sp. SCSIO 66989]